MRSTSLKIANYKEITEYKPEVVILPWGATEAHNLHLPYCTDVIQSEELAIRSANLAKEAGVKPVVLPPVPFGSNAQQLDQYCTINMSARTMSALLEDVVFSLAKQGIKKLVIFNSHGGNNFQPYIRDLLVKYDIFIVVINFWQLNPKETGKIFDEPGDHAGELETALMMELTPEAVQFEQAGKGMRKPFEIEGISQPGVWTPRPWSAVHPDTGAGNPEKATREKGKKYLEMVVEEAAKVIVNVAKAQKGQTPYV